MRNEISFNFILYTTDNLRLNNAKIRICSVHCVFTNSRYSFIESMDWRKVYCKSALITVDQKSVSFTSPQVIDH